MGADSGDRRSSRGTNLCSGNDYQRDRYYRLKAAGLCVRCGRTQVVGRAVCFDCVDSAEARTRQRVARKVKAKLALARAAYGKGRR